MNENDFAQVLVVEDTDSVREVFARQLDVLGVKVHVASGGLEALEAFAKNSYRMVITDFSMPHMNGAELVERFRKIESNRLLADPVVYVLLSADDKRLEALQSGFDEVLLKPVSLNDLRSLMTSWDIPVVMGGLPYDSHDGQAGALDMDIVREQMGDIDDVALGMLARFPAMMEPILDKLIGALDKQDLVSAAVYAHSLKGAARSAGALRFGRKLAGLQARAESGAAVPQHVADELRHEFQDVRNAVSALCH